MTRERCWFPANPGDGSTPGEDYGEWADPSGYCSHEVCAEGNRIGRQCASSRKVSGMTRDEIESLKADHELVRDEYGGKWEQPHGGYVLVADEAT